MKNVAFQPLNLHGDHLSGILHCNTDENKRNAKMMQLPLLSALPRGIIKKTFWGRLCLSFALRVELITMVRRFQKLPNVGKTFEGSSLQHYLCTPDASGGLTAKFSRISDKLGRNDILCREIRFIFLHRRSETNVDLSGASAITRTHSATVL